MALKDLDGRRTGRPKGSRTTSRVRRDILWAYRHLDKPGARPPSAGARLWAALAREHPARFLACVARLEAQAPDPGQPNGTTHGLARRDAGVPPAAPGGGAVNGAGRLLRVKRLFVPGPLLAQCLSGGHGLRVANLTADCMRIVASEADVGREGVWLTIASELFDPVPAGQPVPEFRAAWQPDPRSY
jgi:hypothetical protein